MTSSRKGSLPKGIGDLFTRVCGRSGPGEVPKGITADRHWADGLACFPVSSGWLGAGVFLEKALCAASSKREVGVERIAIRI